MMDWLTDTRADLAGKRLTPSQSRIARWLRVRMRTRGIVMALALAWVPCAAAGPQPETTELTDQAITRELGPGETHTYVLSADSDEWLKIVVAQIDVDVAVTAIDPAGQTMLTWDEQGEGGAAEEMALVAEVGGEHRIEVRPADSHFGGRYEIRLAERRRASPRDRRWFAAESAHAKAEATYPWRDGAALRAALPLYETAIEGWHALGERRREAVLLTIIGSVHHQLGEHQKAIEKTQTAQAIAREVGDLDNQSTTAANLAIYYGELGEQRKAVEELLPTLETARQKGVTRMQCWLESSLATLLGQLGEAQQALEHSRAAWDACRQLDAPDFATHALLSLGDQYSQLGLEQRALEAYAEALAVARRAGSAFVASIVLTRTGNIQLRQGEPRKAAETLKEALSFAESSGNPQATGEALIQMGRALTELGETASAAEHFDRAIEIVERTGYRGVLVLALVWRGNLRVATGQLEGAREDYERALGHSRELLHPYIEAAALHGLARVEVASGRFEQALRRSEEAIGVAESLRLKVLSQQSRAEYLATVRPYYELAVDVLMSLHTAHPDVGYDARAFQMSERGRARSLIEGLVSTTDRNLDRIDPDLAQKEHALRERLNGQAARLFRLQAQTKPTDDVAAVRKEVESLLDQLQEIDGRLRASTPADLVDRRHALALPDLQQRALDEQSLLLVYALGERRSFVWGVSRESIVSRELPPRSVVDIQARRLHEALAARNLHPRFETSERRLSRLAEADREANDAARALSEMLVAPLAKELRDRRLLVVADEGLDRVPFAVLPEPGALRPIGKGSPQPLLIRHEVQRVPSASALAHWGLQTLPSPAAKTLAVFADPVFDDQDPRVGARVAAAGQGLEHDWRQELTRSLERSGLAEGGHIPRLPYTREEARVLTALVPVDQRYVALGFDANRNAALSPELAEYRFVHFATHAVVDEATPDLSSVVLSLVDREGRELDGFLRAQDASHLHLNAELVTLSGCSTGLGKQVRGEGTMGLAHSFLGAGARRVLVSLWDVSDHATAEFMARLYRAMLGPRRLRPAAALRETQMAMRAGGRWSAPYYWAGFVLTGDPSDASATPAPPRPRWQDPAPSGRP